MSLISRNPDLAAAALLALVTACFSGGQPFLAEREYQFSAPRAPFFAHDHRSGSSARRILQRSFLPSLSEAHE